MLNMDFWIDLLGIYRTLQFFFRKNTDHFWDFLGIKRDLFFSEFFQAPAPTKKPKAPAGTGEIPQVASGVAAGTDGEGALWLSQTVFLKNKYLSLAVS